MVIEDDDAGMTVIESVYFYSIAYSMATFRHIENDKELGEITVPISKALNIDSLFKLLGNNVDISIKNGILEKIESRC